MSQRAASGGEAVELVGEDEGGVAASSGISIGRLALAELLGLSWGEMRTNV